MVKAERSFYEFCRQAWDIIEPGAPFVDNWHIRMICDECQRLVNDASGRLLINIPPGCMKSLIVNVFFPAWVWGPNNWPSARFFHASYSSDLGVRDSIRCRQLIESDWYASRWGGLFHLTSDQNQRAKFENSKRGYRLTSVVGGKVTGEHPDFKILDDPHSVEKAENEKDRLRALKWYDKTLSTRGRSRGARTLITGQRLKDDDLSGHVLKKQEDEIIAGVLEEKPWVHICLPMKWEPDRMAAIPTGHVDPRNQIGELLWPNLFPASAVQALENILGEAGSAGQLAQRPPEHYEGSEWSNKYFSKDIWFDHWPDASVIALRVITLDPSKGATEKADYQAYIKLALTLDGTMYVEADMQREDITMIAERCFAHSADFKPDKFGIEENFFHGMLSGAVVTLSKSYGFMIPVVEIHNFLKKVQRIRMLTPYLARGEFRFKTNSKGTAMLVNQLKSFPGGLHDDGPDALEMALRLVKMTLGVQ